MKLDSFHKINFPSKRGLFILVVICAGAIWLLYSATQTQLAADQKSLVDIRDIETLRDQFNDDLGKIRLVILLNPT